MTLGIYEKSASSDGRVSAQYIFLQRVQSSNPCGILIFFNREKQWFTLNPQQDLNYHAETRI